MLRPLADPGVGPFKGQTRRAGDPGPCWPPAYPLLNRQGLSLTHPAATESLRRFGRNVNTANQGLTTGVRLRTESEHRHRRS